MSVRALSGCPVENCLSLISSKWKPLILWKLSQKDSMRFSDFRRAIPTITQKMLTQQLRQLEHDRLICRSVSKGLPTKVEYTLTDFGLTLVPVLHTLAQWGESHQDQIYEVLVQEPMP
jgi:DNA-binding HxlR family transcriptional regulator